MIFGKNGKSAQERADGAEKWSGIATLGILVGIVAELISLFLFPNTRTNAETAILAISNVLIGAGLAVEFFCILKAIKANRELKTESDAKLGEALDRASEAQESLIKYLTPRRLLIGPHKSAIIKAAAAFPGTKFDIGFGEGDGEQADIVWDLEGLLNEAGWAELNWGVHTVGLSVIQRGNSGRPVAGSVAAQNVELHIDPAWQQKLLPAAEALVGALNAIEINAAVVPYNTSSIHSHALHILVGPKR